MNKMFIILLLVFTAMCNQNLLAYHRGNLEDFDPMADLNRVFIEEEAAEEQAERLFFYHRFSRSCTQLLVGKVRDGMVVHQGDILLGAEGTIREVTDIEDAKASANSVSVAGFAVNLLSRSAYAWPHGVIPYTIDENLKHKQSVILSAIKEWNEKTNVTMVHYDLEQDWLKSHFGYHKTVWRIHFVGHDKNYSSSYVGLRKVNLSGKANAQPIHLNKRCSRDTVLHEIGHALGLWHEHNRPDRDQFIKIIKENIEQNDRDQYDVDYGTKVGNYDLLSIMHYSQHTFALDGKVSFTLLKKPTAHESSLVGNVRHISKGDIAAVNAIYPKAVCHRGPFLLPGEKEDVQQPTVPDFDLSEPISAEQKANYERLILEKLPSSHPAGMNKVIKLECKRKPIGDLDIVNCVITMGGHGSEELKYEASIHINAGAAYAMFVRKYDDGF